MSSEGLHVPRDRLGRKTLPRHDAIASLIDELEAVDWRRQRADEDKAPRGIPPHNAAEALEHAAMVLDRPRRRDPEVDGNPREYLFKDGSITGHEEKATGRT